MHNDYYIYRGRSLRVVVGVHKLAAACAITAPSGTRDSIISPLPTRSCQLVGGLVRTIHRKTVLEPPVDWRVTLGPIIFQSLLNAHRHMVMMVLSISSMTITLIQIIIFKCHRRVMPNVLVIIRLPVARPKDRHTIHPRDDAPIIQNNILHTKHDKV